MDTGRSTGTWLHDRDIHFLQHPQFKGVGIAWLMSGDDGAAAMSCALVEMTSAATVKAHTHPFEDDIVYCLRGSAKMWMDGVGDIDVSEGTFVRVPAGVAHCLHDFSDDFKAFDMFLVDPEKRRQFKQDVERLPLVEFVPDSGISGSNANQQN